MWLISPSNTGSLVIPAEQTEEFQLGNFALGKQNCRRLWSARCE
jgi:hypothetical protein